MSWYAKVTSGGQGLVIDEATGRTIAVSYDPADAKLLAQAPAMRRALRETADLARELMARAMRVDALLCGATGSRLEVELGEVARMRAQLSRNEALIAEASEPPKG
jgi:hypothetical protein